MKHFRNSFVILLAIVLLSALVSCTNNTNVTAKDTVSNETLAPSATSPNSADTKITADEAKELALGHFGLSGKAVTEIRFEYDRNDRNFEYEFIFEGKEYEIEISSVTGNVIDADIDNDRYTKTETTVSSTEPTPDKNISKDEAIDIAINHFGLKKENCKFITAERDDGKFEIEFFSEGIEYNAKIDPVTGKVLEWESERAD